MELTPAFNPSELAQFLRQKAEECLRLARAMADESAAAKELIIMAASLHDRAVKLEASPAPLAEAKELPQATDDVPVRSHAGILPPGK